jgi:two-component system, OmpR family, copper resistance phosphate regulon response regulator CusR
MARILVVEDEAKVADALEAGLAEEQYEVEVAYSGEDGFVRLGEATFDLVLLDVMLPGRDGIDLLTMLRRRGLTTPVLLLTARDAVEDRVLGLESGADDYLVKPFAFPELVARIRALLRRGRADQSIALALADLHIDPLTRRVMRAGKTVALTTREYELLEYLVRQRDRIVSREMLARDVWQETARATPLDNVIDVYIARVRRKLDALGPRLIHTIRGVGFTASESAP